MRHNQFSRARVVVLGCIVVTAGALVSAAVALGGGGGGTIPGDPNPIVPAFIDDFFIPGSQPFSLVDDLSSANGDCATCHVDADPAYPYNRWNHSLMGQAARDPISSSLPFARTCPLSPA